MQSQIDLNGTSTQIYKKEMLEALKLSFPEMYESELMEAINWSIAKRSKDTNVVLDNNYEKKKQN